MAKKNKKILKLVKDSLATSVLDEDCLYEMFEKVWCVAIQDEREQVNEYHREREMAIDAIDKKYAKLFDD